MFGRKRNTITNYQQQRETAKRKTRQYASRINSWSISKKKEISNSSEEVKFDEEGSEDKEDGESEARDGRILSAIKRLRGSSPPAWQAYACNRIRRVGVELGKCSGMPKGDQLATKRYLVSAKQAARWPKRRRIRRWWSGVDIETAWRSIHAAEALIYENMSDSELRGRLPRITSYTAKHLADVENERQWIPSLNRISRVYTSSLIKSSIYKVPSCIKITQEERSFILWIFRRAQRASDDRNAAVRDFRNFLIIAIGCLTAVAAGIGLMAFFYPQGVPVRLAYNDPSNKKGAGALVMSFGAIGATLAIIRSLTRTPIPARESRYSLDVPQMLVKFPAGAITGITGTIIAEWIIDNSLDSSYKDFTSVAVFIIALVCGYSQQLVTRYVDDTANRLANTVELEAEPKTFDRNV